MGSVGIQKVEVVAVDLAYRASAFPHEEAAKNILNFCLNVRTFLDILGTCPCRLFRHNTQQSSVQTRYVEIWVVPRKLKPSSRKLRKSRVKIRLTDTVAKASRKWLIGWFLVSDIQYCPLSHVRPNTLKPPQKQLCHMFTARKSGVWSWKHSESTCERTM